MDVAVMVEGQNGLNWERWRRLALAAAVDDLSNGRLTLGLGAGWQEREHTNYGWDLLDMNGRFARFEEGLHIISHLLQQNAPLDFDGRYYQLHEAVLPPRPQRPGGPLILIGGNGPRRTLPLAVQFASEWNGVFLNPARFRERNEKLNELLAANGRAPEEVRRSLMTGLYFGRDDGELQAKLNGRDAKALRERGVVVGTPQQIVA